MTAFRRRLFSLAGPSVQILTAYLEQPPREGLPGLPVRSCCGGAHGHATFINGHDEGPFPTLAP